MRIDGKEVQAAEGMTVLEAARSAGISIPTLCHHEKLAPFGGCRLCIVEAGVSGPEKHRCFLRASGGRRSDHQHQIREDRPNSQEHPGALAGSCSGFSATTGTGCGLWSRKKQVQTRAILLHSLRSLRPLLCRNQEEARRWIHRSWDQKGNQLPSGDCLCRVQRLQGVLPTVPDLVSPGGFRTRRIASISSRKGDSGVNEDASDIRQAS